VPTELDRVDRRLDHARIQRFLVPIRRLSVRCVVDGNLELFALPPHPERQPRHPSVNGQAKLAGVAWSQAAGFLQ